MTEIFEPSEGVVEIEGHNNGLCRGGVTPPLLE